MDKIYKILLVFLFGLWLIDLLLSDGPTLKHIYFPISSQPLSSRDAKDTVLDPSVAQIVHSSMEKKLFQADGFKFCPILNKAWFDGSVYIYSLNGSIAQVNPDTSVFLNLIDERAHQVYKTIKSKHFTGNLQDIQRFSCYSVAIGNSHFTNITAEKLLVSIDPVEYLTPILPAINLNFEFPQQKRRFKLAYLVMVHETKGFPHLTRLLEVLDDDDAIILVHVDARARSAPLSSKIHEWVNKRRRSGHAGNIHLAKHRFHNIWGHSSLVLTQLSGFWELMDLADWDYVINLSNYDWPLKTNAQVYESLSDPKYMGKNFIEYWPQTEDLTERLYRPHLAEADSSSIFHLQELGLVNLPFTHWKMMKHHQWMIVTPDFVKFLKHDENALNFLAFSEHTYIPDEVYFATVMYNSPKIKAKTLNDNKRYLRFSGDSAHPSWLGFLDRHIFPPWEVDPSFFYVRKLNVYGNVFGEQKLLKWINQYHHEPSINGTINGTCIPEMASVRSKCLKEELDKMTNNEKSLIIVIPVNKASIVSAANLRCSLKADTSLQIIYWALDVSVHESLLKIGKLSIYLAGYSSYSESFVKSPTDLERFEKSKLKIIKMVLEAGYDVTMLDPDSVAISSIGSFLSEKKADVFIGTVPLKNKGLKLIFSLIHIQNTPASVELIYSAVHLLDRHPYKSIEWIWQQVLFKKEHEILVPHGYTFEPKLSTSPSRSEAMEIDSLRIQLLDPDVFVYGKTITSRVGLSFRNIKLVFGLKMNEDLISWMTLWGLWLVNPEGQCKIKVNLNEFSRRLNELRID